MKTNTKRKTSVSAKLRKAKAELRQMADTCAAIIKKQEAEHEQELHKWRRLGRAYKISDPMRRNAERVGIEYMVDPDEVYSQEDAQQMYAHLFEKMSMQFGGALFERNMKLMCARLNGSGSSEVGRAKYEWMRAIMFESSGRMPLDPQQASTLWDTCIGFIRNYVAEREAVNTSSCDDVKSW